MSWIYEQPDWPMFTWDSSQVEGSLTQARYLQGNILGQMEMLGLPQQEHATLNTITQDVVTSWSIEGNNLPEKEVRSSIARRLGVDVGGLVSSSRNVDGIVEMMLDATQNFQKPLTEERLFDWHSAMFPTGRSGLHRIEVGKWRTMASGPMQVVSGPEGRQKVHFEAPPASCLPSEIQAFLLWFEGEQRIDPVLKAGIAHLWFITLHPFEDGNGRIARAICDMAFARADQSAFRFYSMSSQIEAERDEYYSHLEQQQRSSLDITPWLEWFLGCYQRSLSRAEEQLTHTRFATKLWRFIHQDSIHDRQRLILERLIDPDFIGYMNTSKYAKIAQCSTDTALRDLQQLVKRGVLIQNEKGGRSTSYRLVTELELGEEW
jgi:Fic family protein